MILFVYVLNLLGYTMIFSSFSQASAHNDHYLWLTIVEDTLSHTFIISSSYQTKHNSRPAFINLPATTISFAFVGGAGNILLTKLIWWG